MNYGVISRIGAFIIWIYKKQNIPYTEIRDGDYPCYEVGFCFIGILILAIFYLPGWLGIYF